MDQSTRLEGTLESDYDKFRLDLKTAAEKWQMKEQQAESTTRQYTSLQASQEEGGKNLALLRQNEIHAQTAIRKYEAELLRLSRKRQSLLGGKSVEETEYHWQTLLTATATSIEKARTEKEKISLQHEQLKGQYAQLQQACQHTDIHFREAASRLEKWLHTYSEQTNCLLTETELTSLLATDPSFLQSEREALNCLRDQLTAAQTTLDERVNRLSRHLQAAIRPELQTESRENLQTTLADIHQQLARLDEQKAGIRSTLHTQQENLRQTTSLCRQVEEKKVLLEQWSKLDELIGSQSGYKFKEIAQSYTLDILLAYANKQLAELTPRYQLQRIPNELGLQVIDHDLCDEIRSVFSLSGGESFLVSLALALGLSSFASRNHYEENLFIDEGFGTLDAETLQIVMEALERLRSQGRQVGIISHVHELAERIPVRICLIKTGNGRSKIKIEP